MISFIRRMGALRAPFTHFLGENTRGPMMVQRSEHHLVLSQRSCLVGEDAMDLTQVLSDVEGSTLNG